MSKLNQPTCHKIIFIALYFVLNMVNCYLIMTSFGTQAISFYPRSLEMLCNYLLGSFGIAVLVFSLGLFLFRRDHSHFIYLAIMTIFNCIICFAMTIFTDYYGMAFSFDNLQVLDNPVGSKAFGFMLDSLGNLLTHGKYWTFLPCIVLFVYYRVVFRKHRADSPYQISIFTGSKLRYMLAGGVLIGSLLMIGNAQLIYSVRSEGTWHEQNDDPLYGIQNSGMYNYYLRNLTQYLSDKQTISDENLEQAKAVLESYKEPKVNHIDGNYYLNHPYQGVYKDKNLLLIQSESMNSFVLGLKINGKEITPNLNQMVRQGIYFDQFYSTVGIGNTSDAEFSTMTGFYPQGTNFAVYQQTERDFQTLAKDFSKSNYRAISFHGNDGLFYARNTIFPQVYGFERHYSLEDFSSNYHNYIHERIADEDLLYRTIDEIASRDGLTFAYAILVSCHTPYGEDNNLNHILTQNGFSLKKDIQGSYLRGYLEHAYYVDWCMGKMLSYMEQKGILNDTVIALYGDHGGVVSEKDFKKNADTFSYDDVNSQFNEINWKNFHPLEFRKISQQIPFLIYEGSQEKQIAPQIISLVRSQVDIYQTMSRLFALETLYYFGVDALSNEPAISYSPKTLDVMTDYGMISMRSSAVYQPQVDLKQLKRLADLAFCQKDWNDKVLKYNVLPIKTK